MNILISTLSQVIGGLGIFLYGMRIMSESIEEIAGYRLRKLISQMTSNLFKGILLGGVVTAIIQSSSVTTVMAVGFVNSGLMTLKQSIGVIFGANIGTTITGWILALKVTKYGLPLVGIGALIYLFNGNPKRRKQSLAIMGLGMIFLGLTFMKAGVKPLRDMPSFISFFSLFSAETYKGVILSALTGAMLTAILQSSSATVGITMALASQEIISAETAVALVLGENIGTTITAYLSSLGTTTEAKRVAYAHILIKVIGVCIILPLFYPYLIFVSKFLKPEDGVTKYIALSHTIFNIGLVVLLLPFVGSLLKILNKLANTKKIEKIYLKNECLYKVPSLVLEKSKEETLQMLIRFQEDMTTFYNIILNREEINSVEKIFQGEEFQDKKKDDIHIELTGLLNCISSQKVLNEARLLMKIADEIESMGDYGASLGKVCIKIKNTNTLVTEKGLKEIETCHNVLIIHLTTLEEIIKSLDQDKIIKLQLSCKNLSLNLSVIDPLEKKEEYGEHIVMEILAKYRRVNRHILYITNAMEKYSMR